MKVEVQEGRRCQTGPRKLSTCSSGRNTGGKQKRQRNMKTHLKRFDTSMDAGILAARSLRSIVSIRYRKNSRASFELSARAGRGARGEGVRVGGGGKN